MPSRLKANVLALLAAGDLESLQALALGGRQGIVGALLSAMYTQDDDLRWRAVSALGRISAAMEEAGRYERVRELVRRLFWMINDESGGVGWHVPEALGEILFRVPILAPAFGPPLATHLEIEPFGPGVLWAIGRISQAAPEPMRFVLPKVRDLLGHGDPLLRGLAAWSLGWAKDSEAETALRLGFSASAGFAFVRVHKVGDERNTDMNQVNAGLAYRAGTVSARSPSSTGVEEWLIRVVVRSITGVSKRSEIS